MELVLNYFFRTKLILFFLSFNHYKLHIKQFDFILFQIVAMHYFSKAEMISSLKLLYKVHCTLPRDNKMWQTYGIPSTKKKKKKKEELKVKLLYIIFVYEAIMVIIHYFCI